MSEFVARRLETIEQAEPVPGLRMRSWAGAGLSAVHARLAPNTAMPQHHHVAEQMGIVLEGAMTITAGTRSEHVSTGTVYRIASDVPHSVQAGPDGCVIIEMFAPARENARPLA